MEKPPYRVPSMAEIAAVEPNGLTVASTFAGCGGSSLGYRMAGFRVAWANEFVPIAQSCYRANMAPGTVLDGRDIREVRAEDILTATGLREGELDLFDGSPPCQAFSTAGRREKGWKSEKTYEHGAKQKNQDLFFEYCRLLRGLRPRAFVAENVSGLVKGVAKGYFLDILARLKRGYVVEARLLDAQWLGVPQQRQRIIFVGVRADLAARGIAPAFPAPFPHRYSVRDALPWIGRVVHDTSGLFGAGDVTNRPSPTVTVGVNSVNSRHFQVEDADAARIVYRGQRGGERYAERERSLDEPAPTVSEGGLGSAARHQYHVVERVLQGPQVDQRNEGRDLTDEPAPTVAAGAADRRTPRQFVVERSVMQVEPETDISRQAIGQEYDRLNPGQQSDKYFSLVRADASEPCPAITAAGGQNSGIACAVHPTEKRKFSIAELRRICAFPDDFALEGTYAQQWERLGNSVPPLMMRAIAEAVRDRVLLPAREAAPRARARSRTPRPARGSRARSTTG